MRETGIIWTESTWNPVSGCQKISQGCKFCYASELAERYRGTPAFPNGFDVTYRPKKLNFPLSFKEPHLFFVNSMSDFFWEKISDEYRDKMLDVMIRTPHHEYQVLTKRPEIMRSYFSTRKVPPNFWAGVTIEDSANLWRLDALKKVDATIRFISFEPLIGDIGAADLSGIHWAITGGESGSHLWKSEVAEARGLVRYDSSAKKWQVREDRAPWIRNIRDLCDQFGVAFFHKQWGGHYPEAAGRLLDGRYYSEWPRLPKGKTTVDNAYLRQLEATPNHDDRRESLFD